MSRPLDLVLRAERVVTPGGDHPAAVGVRDGRIAVIAGIGEPLAAEQDVRLEPGQVLMPGLVDTHVHLQDPGRDGWEGFASGTLAAAAGGVTTVVDMPLDSRPVTVDAASLAVKVAAAAGRAAVDLGFWGGLTAKNSGALPALAAAGVLGLKCFLLDPGDPDFPPVDDDGLVAGLVAARDLRLPLLVHAEHPQTAAHRGGDGPAADGADYRAWLATRPAEAETAAVAQVLDAVRRTGGRAHLVHLSSAGAVELVRRARAQGLPVSAETCPHYLTLTADDVPAGDTRFVAGPPIREPGHADALWAGLADGTIAMVVSDHSPMLADPAAGPSPATGGFAGVPGGIVSLQVSLPVVWTAARARGFGLVDVARWMATAPAALAGLDTKGAIGIGRDADLLAFAPEAAFEVDPAALHHRLPTTPYAGRTLAGVVVRTWLRGRVVDAAGPPRGRTLLSSRPSTEGDRR